MGVYVIFVKQEVWCNLWLSSFLLLWAILVGPSKKGPLGRGPYFMQGPTKGGLLRGAFLERGHV